MRKLKKKTGITFKLHLTISLPEDCVETCSTTNLKITKINTENHLQYTKHCTNSPKHVQQLYQA